MSLKKFAEYCVPELKKTLLLRKMKEEQVAVNVTFLSLFLDVRRMSMSTVSFLAQLDSGILWNAHFPLTYDNLNGFKSRSNRSLLTVDSFYIDFLYGLVFLCYFLL